MKYHTHLEVYMNTRTNVVLDDKLVRDAMKATGAKTKRDVLTRGLQELVRLNAQNKLIELRGSGMLDPKYNHKKARMGH